MCEKAGAVMKTNKNPLSWQFPRTSKSFKMSSDYYRLLLYVTNNAIAASKVNQLMLLVHVRNVNTPDSQKCHDNNTTI